jgi:large subunit ribosomal protein L6
MKREIFEYVEIPEGVEVNVEGNLITAKGTEGSFDKKINLSRLEVTKEEGKLKIGCKKSTKKEKKMIFTTAAHLRNMIAGVSKKFEYQMKICFSHFPITVEVRGNEMIIKNFLGERSDRKTSIPKGAEIEVNREMITVKSMDKEVAGQAAANIEKATKVGKRDRRVFQDGIFIINKAGKEI